MGCSAMEDIALKLILCFNDIRGNWRREKNTIYGSLYYWTYFLTFPISFLCHSQQGFIFLHSKIKVNYNFLLQGELTNFHQVSYRFFSFKEAQINRSRSCGSFGKMKKKDKGGRKHGETVPFVVPLLRHFTELGSPNRPRPCSLSSSHRDKSPWQLSYLKLCVA